MFQSVFEMATTDTAAVTWQSVVSVICIAFLLGVFISCVYMKTYKSGVYSQSFTLTLVMMPIIIALIILLIGSNIARAFSLAGVFSIIRFRSSMGDPKDVAYVFFTVAVGLALGVGFIAYAVLFALVLCSFMFLLCRMNFGVRKEIPKTLRITIPENLDYGNVFDDIFSRYTKVCTKKRTKTTELGSLYELVYDILLKNESEEKEFVDELRCRNGNLTISISVKEEEFLA